MTAELMIRIRANAAEADAAFKQVGAGLQRIEAQSQGVSRAFRQNSAVTGNLAAQFQDIGVMLAAGQNPLQLAIQQGSQISQVLGPMGAAGAAKALGGAFLSLLNPTTFITMAVIAGGAALFQWATRSDEAAESSETLSERLGDVTGAIQAYRQFSERAALDTVTLREEFGYFGETIRELNRYMAEVSVGNMMRELSTAGDPIQAQADRLAVLLSEKGRLDAEIASVGEYSSGGMQVDLAEVQDEITQITRDLGLLPGRAIEFAEALGRVESASGMAEVRDRAIEALEVLREFYPEGERMPQNLADATEELERIVREAQRAAMAGQDMNRAFSGAAGAAERIAGAMSLTHPRLGTIAAGRGATPAGFGGEWDAAGSGILDLIAYAEGTRGNYNETLDYGRWTGGPVNLTGMTINEVLALQDTMRTPENRALYGDGLGSSAVGRYQIVSSTLRGLVGNLGLSGNEFFDEQMQDRMALQLIRENGGGVGAVRGQWEGFGGGRISDAMIRQALQGTAIPSTDPETAQASAAALEATAQAVEQADSAYRSLSGTLDRSVAIQQAFAEGQKVISDALSAGVISTEEAAAATDLLVARREDALAGLTNVMEGLEASTQRGADAFANLFLSIGDGADGVKKAFAQILAQMAQVAAIRGFRGLAESSGGAGFFGFIGDLLSLDAGGFTGNGPRSAVAGVVHGGEYVFSAPAVDRIGLGALDRLHKGYADGGYVGSGSGDMGGLHVTVGIRQDGGLEAFVADQAGRIVAASAPGIVRESVNSVDAAMRQTKSFGRR